MLAVLPDPQMGLPEAMQRPLRLKIAVTSDWDGQSPKEEAEGWFSWQKYVDWLNARGCANTALVVTKMKFDPEAAFPKVFFSAERPLQPEELTTIGPLTKSHGVLKLLNGTYTPAGADGVPVGELATAQSEAVVETAAETVAAAAPPPANPSEINVDAPAGYVMSETEQHSYQQYRAGGWTDEQLISNGKLIAATPPLTVQPEVVAVAEPAPPPVQPVAEAIVVGESAAGAVKPTPEVQSTALVDTVVVETTPQPAAATVAATAPAAVVIQEPAQATTPAPAPTPQAPEPPAAAAAAAAASPEVSADVPADVADLLAEWGPEAT